MCMPGIGKEEWHERVGIGEASRSPGAHLLAPAFDLEMEVPETRLGEPEGSGKGLDLTGSQSMDSEQWRYCSIDGRAMEMPQYIR